ERRQLDALELLLQCLECDRELLREIGVGLVFEQLVHRDRVVELAPQAPVASDPGSQAREPRRQPLGTLLVVPERGIGGVPHGHGALRGVLSLTACRTAPSSRPWLSTSERLSCTRCGRACWASGRTNSTR